MLYTHIYQSLLGNIELFSDAKALVGLQFEGQKYAIHGSEVDASRPDLPIFQQTTTWLDAYFRGANPGLPPPLKLQGTPFRLEVWRMLQSIPYGTTITYGTLARTMAYKCGKKSMSAQAIGGAVGHNPISIIIPCHRVVGSRGNLTGYAGGIERKKKLLAIEASSLHQAL